MAKSDVGYRSFVTQLIDDREWLEEDNAEKEQLLAAGYRTTFHQLMIFEGRPYLVAVLEKRPDFKQGGSYDATEPTAGVPTGQGATQSEPD